MIKITVEVKGMACGMCESHVNDVVRRNAKVKKVTSSHSKNETVIICENEIDLDVVRQVISAQGYTVGEIKSEPYEKKGLFSFLKK